VGYVDDQIPNNLLIHGNHDSVVPSAQSIASINAAPDKKTNTKLD